MAAFAVDAFRPLDEFKRDIADFVKYVKDTPPAEGFKEVLYPGELEHRTEQQRRREGIPIEDETWRQLTGLAEASGVAMPPAR
jgi:LDH2 family malate/lactate/ureidoglycolate dehydrogenase